MAATIKSKLKKKGKDNDGQHNNFNTIHKI
jgi:hypothetical protein